MPPSITSITGTFANGQTLTINGSGFGTKSPAKPLIWADFEGGTIVEDANYSTGTLLQQGCTITTLGSPVWGTYSVRGSPADLVANVRLYCSVTNARYNFCFVRRKYDHASWWPTGNINYKFLRHWPTFPNSGSTNFLFAFLNTTQDYLYRWEGMPTPFGDEKYPGFGTSPVQTWFTEEFEIAHNSNLDVADGVVRSWEDTAVRANSTTETTRDATRPTLFNSFGIENLYSINPPPAGAYVYMDDCYIDSSWARVMLGTNATNSTFDGCTKRLPFIPTAWNDSQITAYIPNLADQTSGTRYIFVVDSAGARSAGFDVASIGVAAVGVPMRLLPAALY